MALRQETKASTVTVLGSVLLRGGIIEIITAVLSIVDAQRRQKLHELEQLGRDLGVLHQRLREHPDKS